MSQLKYIITADDSDFKKKMLSVAKLASESGGKMVSEVNKAVESEVKKRMDVTKVIHEQTAAIAERNKEEAKAPVRKPISAIDIPGSSDKVIASGTVVNPKDIERATIANQAYSKSVHLAKQGLDQQAASTIKLKVTQVQQLGLLETMKDKLNDLKRAQDTTTDPSKIRQYASEIQKTEVEIKRMSNAGKVGFDDMGNAIKKSGNLIQRGLAGLFKLAYILPGLGVAGMLAFAIDPIVKWISSMGEATESAKAFNKVKQESANSIAKEVAETDILIGKINSSNISQTERQRLLTEFISKNPAVLSALNLQNIATAEGKNIIDDYIVSLKEKIRLQALEQGYVNAVQKAADARSGALSDETDLKGYNKFARTIGDILLFRGEEDTSKFIEEENQRRREASGKTYDIIADNLLKEIELEVKSAKEIAEIKDTSLRAMETQLSATNERLRNLQKGESAKTLLAEKKQLEDQIKQRQELLGLDKKKTPSTSAEVKSENAAASMYKRIEALRQEYTRKVMTQDEAELQSARDKFANLAAEVTKFNADPKNKVKIDLGAINTLRDQVISDLQVKQQAARDKIEQEKKEKSLAEAYKLAETHEQAITALQKKYSDARKEIGDKITQEQSAALDLGLKNETDVLNKNLIEQLDSYKYFFENLAELSGAKLNEGAAALEKDLADLVAKNPELKKFADILTKRITGAKTAKTAEDFRDMADSLSFMADAVQDFGGGLSDAFRTASDLAGQVSNLKNDMAAFNAAMAIGNSLGGVASGIGIIGAGFNIMSTLNNLFDRTTASDEQRLRNSELQLQATEGMTKALERQIKIANEAYGTQKIEEYRKAVDQAKKTIEESGKALEGRTAFTGDAEIDKVIEKMNKGEKLKGWKLWGDSEKDLAKYIKDYPKLTTNVEELQRLLDAGKLDSQTAQIAQNFIDAHDAIEESKNAIIAFQTGIDFDTLSDNLIDAISSGDDAIAALGQNFEDTMKNAILNSLKDGAFAKEMQKWYEEFNAAMDDGLTEQEIAVLREGYTKIGEDQLARLKEYEKVTGLDLTGKKEAEGKGTSGIIGRAITEDSANKWMGIQLNIYTITKNHFAETQLQTTIMEQYSNYAFQNLNAALNIERNTANTVIELRSAVSRLDIIATNTKPSKTARDLG